MKKLTASLALCALFASSGAAQAALIDRGGGLIYDTDLNITWLANANLAATNTFGLARNVDLGAIPGVNAPGGSYIYDDGSMTWGGAMKWIAAMNASNGGEGYLGYNNWRLPSATDTGTSGCNWSFNGTDCGYYSVGSEMAHLYYSELGNAGYSSAYQSGYGLGLVDDPANPNDESLFTNFQSSLYWSGTEYASEVSCIPATDCAWQFGFNNGYQFINYKGVGEYALAVRTGDVTTVPVPAAAWLLGSGLLGMFGVAKRKSNS